MLPLLHAPFFVADGIGCLSRMCLRRKSLILLFILMCNIVFILFSSNVQFNFTVWKKSIYKNDTNTKTQKNVTAYWNRENKTVLQNTALSRHTPNGTLVQNMTVTTNIDPNVRFILNPSQVCPQDSRLIGSDSNKTAKILLSIIHTARHHFNARSILRNTIGSVKSYRNWSLPVLFIVGTDVDPKATTKTDNLLVEESHKHNDIILADFVDTYRNLSLKHLVALHWATQFCPQASFYLKTDDDYLIEIFQVVDVISAIPNDDTNFHCYSSKGWPPHREPKDKYYVSVSEFPGKKFPELCNGMYVTRMPTIKKILEIYRRQQVKYLYLEDVYVSGILREAWNNQTGITSSEKINITTGKISGHLNTQKSFIDKEIPKKSLTEIYTDRNSSRTCQLWKKILSAHNLQNTTIVGC